MTNTSEKTYKELASPYFGEVFSLIEKICIEQRIPIYLIGAHAKIMLLLEKDIKPGRGTKDIDFAVMMPDIASYEYFLTGLEKEGFRKVKEPYRLIYNKTNTVVDILPFGQIEEEGTVRFTERRTELSVVGMEEVLEKAVTVKHEGFDIKLPPLVGILILKLISWNENPDRKKDLDDVYDIVKDFYEFSKDSFYENHLEMVDEFETVNFMLEVGSFMIGKEMKEIIKDNQFLYDSIKNIVAEELDELPGSISMYYLQKEYFKEHKFVKRVFTLINKGLND